MYRASAEVPRFLRMQGRRVRRPALREPQLSRPGRVSEDHERVPDVRVATHAQVPDPLAHSDVFSLRTIDLDRLIRARPPRAVRLVT